MTQEFGRKLGEGRKFTLARRGEEREEDWGASDLSFSERCEFLGQQFCQFPPLCQQHIKTFQTGGCPMHRIVPTHHQTGSLANSGLVNGIFFMMITKLERKSLVKEIQICVVEKIKC